jgi:hypothetical protein
MEKKYCQILSAVWVKVQAHFANPPFHRTQHVVIIPLLSEDFWIKGSI